MTMYGYTCSVLVLVQLAQLPVQYVLLYSVQYCTLTPPGAAARACTRTCVQLVRLICYQIQYDKKIRTLINGKRGLAEGSYAVEEWSPLIYHYRKATKIEGITDMN